MATSGQIPSDITLAGGEALRRNAGDTAFEAFTPSGGGGSPAGSSNYVQYNNAGAFGAEADFQYNPTSNQLLVKNVYGAVSAGAGSPLTIQGGSAASGTNTNGGDLYLYVGSRDGSGTDGVIYMGGGSGNAPIALIGPSAAANLDLSLVTSDRTYKYANVSGTHMTTDLFFKLTSDYTVTNSTTLATVTGFSFSVTSGDSWYVEVIGSSTASDTTGDIKADFVTTGTWVANSGFSEGYHYSATGGLTTRAATIFTSTTAAMGGGIAINNGDAVVRPFRFIFQFTANGTGTAAFQIANVAASSGRTSTIKAGSYMIARKLTI